ncbi:ecto-ADP-ribosyltransferase 4-like [Notolabrus celidotus]|uniref:ecto-ADP-ribosyltransferase 4-like n=1 Tax=Notolabrus celidotus TaxID=1203425 RepID=UPI00148F6343|nr:ecto-ADP-ribosyltransferase 4-like [Notolabrus celidotus]
MKSNIHFIASMLVLFWLQPLHSKKISYIISQHKDDRAIPLSMVKDSVDDMYSGCTQAMQKVAHKYFDRENKGVFQRVWKKAEKCTKRNMNHKEDGALTKEHLQAICVYTTGFQRFHDLFNAAVRTNRSEYSTSFPFHSLHFWLTSAIQILNNNKHCLESYRRSNSVFTGKVNQVIRFGFFASTSKSTKLTRFGTETCFKIKTCHGAYLKKYPTLKDHEKEVLIPPYEMFMISQIGKKRLGNLSQCKTIYVLESVGYWSNLNCKAAKLDQSVSRL